MPLLSVLENTYAAGVAINIFITAPPIEISKPFHSHLIAGIVLNKFFHASITNFFGNKSTGFDNKSVKALKLLKNATNVG